MKYQVTEPYRAYLYISHVEFFHEKLSSLLVSKELSHLDYRSVIKYLCETLDQVYLPDFAVSFDNWLSSQPASQSDRYLCYFKDNHGLWRKNILKQNAFIERLATHICESTLANLTLFMDRFQNEKELLQNTFGLPVKYSTGAIEIMGGDRHENGQQPVLLTLGEARIIYKPRDSQIENVLNDICAIAGIAPVCPKTLSRKTHIWQNYVDNRPLQSLANASDVYKRYGTILSLVDLFNINDCHFDNFIVDEEHVYFIDPETSFQYFFEDTPAFERSIFQSGLLQSPEVVMNGIGHTSAITAATNIFQSYTYPHALNDASEDIQVRYEHGFAKRTHNYPHYEGKPVLSAQYIDDVIAGYKDGYARLRTYSVELIARLEINDNIKPRYLIRTTAYYMLVINKIIHPDTSREFNKKFNPLIERFLHYDGAHPRFSELIPYEAFCLSNFDVPIFYTGLNTTSLFSEYHGEITDFFPCAPIEQIRLNFYRQPDYLNRQCELIARSMNVHA